MSTPEQQPPSPAVEQGATTIPPVDDVVTPSLLTDAEHALVADLGLLWGRFCRMVGDGPTREADLDEVVIHIHALQHFVMAQAAARAHPDLYRLAGGTLRPLPADEDGAS